MAEPTAECLRQAQAGDPQALTELIMGQQHYVYSIAMSVLHQPEDAADLTQEVFIRLMRVLPQYSGESRFTTWLYRLVVNLCRDELRRRGRQGRADSRHRLPRRAGAPPEPVRRGRTDLAGCAERGLSVGVSPPGHR